MFSFVWLMAGVLVVLRRRSELRHPASHPTDRLFRAMWRLQQAGVKWTDPDSALMRLEILPWRAKLFVDHYFVNFLPEMGKRSPGDSSRRSKFLLRSRRSRHGDDAKVGHAGYGVQLDYPSSNRASKRCLGRSRIDPRVQK
jgi:hypothetical protein